MSHVERCHDLNRPYQCSICSQAFFLSSRLREHIRTSHRPGRYRCPFCSFKTDNLSGFRRHSGRCNYRDEDLDEDLPNPTRTQPELDQDDFDRRPRRRTSRVVVEDED